MAVKGSWAGRQQHLSREMMIQYVPREIWLAPCLVHREYSANGFIEWREWRACSRCSPAGAVGALQARSPSSSHSLSGAQSIPSLTFTGTDPHPYPQPLCPAKCLLSTTFIMHRMHKSYNTKSINKESLKEDGCPSL